VALYTTREIVGEAAKPHYSFYCFPLYSVVPHYGMSKKELGVLLCNMETITFTSCVDLCCPQIKSLFRAEKLLWQRDCNQCFLLSAEMAKTASNI
jgi:hypothetical protein